MTAEPKSHNKIAKFFHWGFIVVFIYALTKQLDEVEELEDLSLLQYEMIFASLFLVLVIARFTYMAMTMSTAMPDDTPKRDWLLARSVHLAMYFCMAMIPITGLVIGWLYGAATKSGFAMDSALLLHEIFINTGFFLIAGHIAAAIYHRRKADGIWDSMVPFWNESPKDSNA